MSRTQVKERRFGTTIIGFFVVQGSTRGEDSWTNIQNYVSNLAAQTDDASDAELAVLYRFHGYDHVMTTRVPDDAGARCRSFRAEVAHTILEEPQKSWQVLNWLIEDPGVGNAARQQAAETVRHGAEALQAYQAEMNAYMVREAELRKQQLKEFKRSTCPVCSRTGVSGSGSFPAMCTCWFLDGLWAIWVLGIVRPVYGKLNPQCTYKFFLVLVSNAYLYYRVQQ
ncbi:hypothetical protein K440DRAFT_667958 [Wilcoxina mikolae CBS 423.85]|nr:hypothetical protein K440DRAFT_667958 [Wilcoxina mikolae CBS 423.85]